MGGRRMTLSHAMLEFVKARDHRLMSRVNGWSAPKWVRIWMICATRGGDGWLWYAMGLAILLFGGQGALCRDGRGGRGIRAGYRRVPLVEAADGQAPAMSDPTALLGDAVAAGSVLLSVRALDHCFRGCHASQPFLSFVDGRLDDLRYQRRGVARPARHALSERRTGRFDSGSLAGLLVVHRRSPERTAYISSRKALRSPPACRSAASFSFCPGRNRFAVGWNNPE